MAKKMVRILPKISLVVPGTTYNELVDGDCFILDKKLWIKADDCGDQSAVNLMDGTTTDGLCDNVVVPVDVEIKWKTK